MGRVRGVRQREGLILDLLQAKVMYGETIFLTFSFVVGDQNFVHTNDARVANPHLHSISSGQLFRSLANPYKQKNIGSRVVL